MTPPQRSLAHLRAAGYMAEVVERWIPGANIRRDLFGFADIIAMHMDRALPLMFVQTTTAAHAADHRKKLLKNTAAKALVDRGCEVVLHSWAVRGKKGQRKLWTCDAEWVTADQF